MSPSAVQNSLPLASLIHRKSESFVKDQHSFQVISLFTGAGGFDLGLEMAGYSTRACVEIIPKFRATLFRNRPDWNPIEDYGGDVTKISADLLLDRAGLKKDEVALIVGGPPCQSFSNMGKRKGIKDGRGKLYLDYVRLIKDIHPLGFVFENVEGIKQHGVLNYIQTELEKLGYIIECRTLSAADYGVPQKRKRVIVIGCLGVKPIFPIKTHSRFGDVDTQKWVTVREAFGQIKKGDLFRIDCLSMNHSSEMKKRMAMVPPGGNFHQVPKKYLPKCWTNGKHQGQDTFGRLLLNEPSITIRTSGYNPTKGRYIHPTENRGLNTVEMAVLQSFPKDYIFEGNLKDVGTQIGNAVPPLLARAIGEALKPCLLEARSKLHSK